MKFGIFGSGTVGETIANKLVDLGHQVMLGSRDGNNVKIKAWAKKSGADALAGSFPEAAAFGQIDSFQQMGAEKGIRLIGLTA